MRKRQENLKKWLSSRSYLNFLMDEERRFISMLSDYGFKITFGNENHPAFIKRALQALIASDTPIRKVRFTKNEVSGTTKDSRGGLFDMTCEDELGRVFIVEMQLLNLSSMIHRAKFYAFHIYNKMVRKGNYHFDDLKKIYTVSILAGKTYKTGLYHQIGTIRNQQGELMDNQITHVVIELGKFEKTFEQVTTDLDKLLYTMKLTDTAPQDVQLPDFMREGWLEETLAELDRANLTPDQRADWEMTIAGNMSVKAYWEEEMEKDKAKVRKETEARVKKETEARVKKETEARVKKEASKKLKEAKKEAEKAKQEAVVKMIRRGFDATEVSEIMNMPITSVKAIMRKTGSDDQ